MLDHARREAQREIGKSANVDVDDAELLGAIELGRPAEQAEARIVDEILDLGVRRAQRRFDLVAGIPCLQIAGDQDRRLAACGCDFTRQRVEPIRPPRHQRQTMTVRGKDARQFGTYAR